MLSVRILAEAYGNLTSDTRVRRGMEGLYAEIIVMGAGIALALFVLLLLLAEIG